MPVRVPIETLRLQSVALEYLVKSRLKRATGRLSASAIDQLAPVTPEALIAWSAPALVGKPLVWHPMRQSSCGEALDLSSSSDRLLLETVSS